MKKLVAVLAAGILNTALLLPAQAQIREITNMDVAIEEAAEQATLSQRILKDYALVVLKVKSSKYRKELSDSIKRYDDVIEELHGYPGAMESAEKPMAKADAKWQEVKELLVGPPQKGKAHAAVQHMRSCRRHGSLEKTTTSAPVHTGVDALHI